MEKKLLVEELWKKFTEKIIQEWDDKYKKKYGAFSGVNSIEKPFEFARSVHKDFRLFLKNKGVADDKIISFHTINNSFQRNGFSGDTKNKTLDAISQYLGYKNWDDFCVITENKTNVQTSKNLLPVIEVPEFKSLKLKSVESKKRKHRKGFFLLLLLMITIISISFLYWKYLNRIKVEKAKIEKIIRAANEAEKQAYLAVPNIDTAFFDTFYTTESEIRKDILDRLITDITQRINFEN